ncbi:hypothetical protein HA49_08705 [Tatumella morbirosei]|uniref:Uncharacterized protein n=1 Tax=Tatumella morbirosei TaxID=642227 RepID=A0A095VKY5_9GAMM|nr:hypothetical protein [Tatumella morbirosei]KGD75295.1 hypothetical protein HA49_08705 [Tatumella morbirosei]
MNNQHSEKPKNITEHRYLILDRPAGHVLFCLITIFYCVYCVLTPIFYALATDFPEEKDIHYSEGLFTYRDAVNKNYQIGVRTGSSTEFFSCKSSYLSPNLCEIDRKYYDKLKEHLKKNNKRTNVILEPKLYQQWQDKPAIISWFWQRYSIFGIDKKVIRVIIDGEEVVSGENVRKTIISNHDDWWINIAMSLPFILFTFVITRQVILNKEIKNEQ